VGYKRGIDKKNFICLVFILAIILGISFISATITVVRPLNNTNYTGAFGPLVVFNVTYLNSTDFTDATNVTFYYNRSGVWTRIGSSTACSKAVAGALASCNATLNLSGLTDGRYSINATLANTSTSGSSATNNYTLYGANNIIFNVTFDSTPPAVNFTGFNTINNGNYSGVMVLNASATNTVLGVDSVYFNITFSNGTQVNFTKASTASGGYYNISFNTSNLADGYYNITVFANDSYVNNLNNTEKISILIDNTAPTGTFSCSPSIGTSAGVVSCTCTPSDALIGVNTSTLSYVTTPPIMNVGNFSLNCSFADMIGNVGSVITYYVINPIGSLPSGSSSGGGSSTPSTVNALDNLAPGVPVIVSNSDSNSGIKQIQIEVSSTTKNVKVTIDKSDAKPSSVSEKTDAYKYFHIQTQNLANNLSKATLTIQVMKSWIAGKGIDKADVVLYKYDETANQWNALTTTFKSEDSSYDYYTVDLTSFSYFAIAPKQLASTTEEQQETSEETPITTSSSTSYLPFIIAGIVFLTLVFIGSKLLKKKKKRK
jgi:PGF-pre-PGF domain-containing protein